jgi:hypothetical protein
MTDLTENFFRAYLSAFSRAVVYTEAFPEEMKASEKDASGWIEWKPIKGTLLESDYHELEKSHGLLFPKSFISWHKLYYFLDGDCSIVRLPHSNPKQPLKSLRQTMDWPKLIQQKLYPFADEGNDAGVLVFDGRQPAVDNEFPIRFYDHDFGGDIAGLGSIIFSSFSKLLQCLTHYMSEVKTRRGFDIIPEFFKIDPEGAGKDGVDYWLSWSAMLKANFEEFGY